MSIPFFSLERQWHEMKTSIMPAIKNVLESTSYIGGPYVREFEKNLAKFVKAEHAIGCNSGTDALWLAIKTLGVTQGSLILTTPFSFVASSSEIIAHNALPIFIDIDQASYNISPNKIKNWLEKNTIKNGKQTIHRISNAPVKGVIAVNLFGLCADYEMLHDICKEWNLWLIEDAAQSLGAEYKTKRSGNLADISCFSFYPTKNVGAYGDGGALTTNNEEYAQALRRFANHGRASHYAYTSYGINSRLDSLQAAILNEKLRVADTLNIKRQRHAARYRKHLKHIPELILPNEQKQKSIFHQFSVLSQHREQFVNHLKEHEIGTCIYYPQGLHTLPFLTPEKQYQTSCPVTEYVTEHIVSVPIWPELRDEEIDYICKKIKEMPLPEKKYDHKSQIMA